MRALFLSNSGRLWLGRTPAAPAFTGGISRPSRTTPPIPSRPQAACAYFGRYGADADAEALKQVLLSTVARATVKEGRGNHHRYLGDEYLDERIAGARAYPALFVKAGW
jgi:hypothetical protein